MILPTQRNEQIETILAALAALRPENAQEAYAIEENKRFFTSIRSVSAYISWLYGERKRARRDDLLEINELLPELDDVFHAKMAEIERRPKPGIIEPLVDHIASVAGKCEGRFRLASLGSGSMESERQAVLRVRGNRPDARMTIVGFDISSGARRFAAANLSALPDARIIQVDRIDEKALLLLEEETAEPVLIVISGNDIFGLPHEFSISFFTLAMTALFLHHLGAARRKKLVELMRSLAGSTVQYDGYQSEIVLPLLSLTGWHSPVFLNAAVFSTMRFPNKEEAVALHSGAQIEFYKHGHYRATVSSYGGDART